MWSVPESKGLARRTAMEEEKLNLVSEGCNPKAVLSHPLLDLMFSPTVIGLKILVPHQNFFCVYLIWPF